eukprot:358726-Chlamydomonas_euryale.AAC.5
MLPEVCPGAHAVRCVWLRGHAARSVASRQTPRIVWAGEHAAQSVAWRATTRAVHLCDTAALHDKLNGLDFMSDMVQHGALNGLDLSGMAWHG